MPGTVVDRWCVRYDLPHDFQLAVCPVLDVAHMSEGFQTNDTVHYVCTMYNYGTIAGSRLYSIFGQSFVFQYFQYLILHITKQRKNEV